MAGLWISDRDWDRILSGVPENHIACVKSYLARTHYRVVGLLHIVKRYPLSRYEGLDGELSIQQSVTVGKRFVTVCRAKKRARKMFAIVTLATVFIGGLALGFGLSIA